MIAKVPSAQKERRTCLFPTCQVRVRFLKRIPPLLLLLLHVCLYLFPAFFQIAFQGGDHLK